MKDHLSGKRALSHGKARQRGEKWQVVSQARVPSAVIINRLRAGPAERGAILCLNLRTREEGCEPLIHLSVMKDLKVFYNVSSSGLIEI